MSRILKFSAFESSTNMQFNPEQLHFLNEYCKSWKFNSHTNKIDAYQVEARNAGVLIPEGLQFGKIDTWFDMTNCGLNSFVGFPDEIGRGGLHLGCNNFSNLTGCTQKIRGSFWCFSSPHLSSLEGGPVEVGDAYIVSYCHLKNLQGSPDKIHGEFDCGGNPLESLVGAPTTIKGKFKCSKFQIEPGEWGLLGFSNLLKAGNLSSKGLDLIFSILTPEFIQAELDKDPQRTIVRLGQISHLEAIQKMLKVIRIPEKYRDRFDLVSGLNDLGF